MTLLFIIHGQKYIKFPNICKHIMKKVYDMLMKSCSKVSLYKY